MSISSIVLLALSVVLINSIVSAQGPQAPPPMPNLPQAISKFAPKLLQDIARTFCCDLVISPFSAFSALAALAQGANEATTVHKQLVNGLGISNCKTVVANQFQNYYQELQQTAGSAQLTNFNEIFVQNGFQLNQLFQTVATQKFMTGVQNTDFSDVASIDLINSFVKRKTNSLIQNIVVENAGMISSNTRAILVSGTSFEGSWVNRFDKRDSFQGLFNRSVSIDFMTTVDTFNYAVVPDLDATAVEMEYVNSNLSLVIVLPTINDVNALVENLQNFNWATITDKMQPKSVRVTIPKCQSNSQISLNTYLTDLGMGEMFQFAANLSVPLFDPSIPLVITDVHHTTFIRVDEGQTEIASGTDDISTTFVLAATPIVGPVFEFIANRPFLYYLRDRVENTIIFSGYLKSPAPRKICCPSPIVPPEDTSE